MIRNMGVIFSKFAERYIPDAFVFAVILTIVTFIFGVLIQHKSPVEMINYWGNGFWDLLKFSMQMVLILVTGHVLAQAEVVEKTLRRIAKYAKSPSQAIMITTLVSALGSWLNWGFGLVIGALLAREMAKSIRGIHYGLLVASAYIGFLVWHAGLSGSIPLIIASNPHGVLSKITNGEIIPLSQTIFSYQNYIPVLFLLVTLPLLTRALIPPPGQVVDAYDKFPKKTSKTENKKIIKTPAQYLENSIALTYVIVLAAFAYVFYYFYQGKPFNINIVNFIFLVLGLMLHKRPIKYVYALRKAINVSSGVILQFPFYAGIMGMITHSGLAITLANMFVHVSTEKTLPLLAFYASGLVNMFVPSGGGQWAVQGPVIMPAAAALGVPAAKASMAIAWGESWTNMIQPFWAIPVLSIADLHIRDIMGYCAVAMLWSGLVLSICIYFL